MCLGQRNTQPAAEEEKRRERGRRERGRRGEEEERGATRRKRLRIGIVEQRSGSGALLVAPRGVAMALIVALESSGTCEECAVGGESVDKVVSG